MTAVMEKSHIRNFSIIAHIDHGKSTLSDRILELTGSLQQREMKEQFLDKMDLERERGITIKAQAVRLTYKAKDGIDYQFNLIDTPGHVDFSYEVSRSLSACEGAILVVDAAQGVEAQTMANLYLALDNNLEILPCLNKIDLPAADPERVCGEVEEIIGLDPEHVALVSAKTGEGVTGLLEKIVSMIPAPDDYDSRPLKALVIDSWYDSYQGAMALLRVMEGKIKTGDEFKFMSSGDSFMATDLGVYSPHPVKVQEISSGEVGFLAGNIKTIASAKVGDTITLKNNPADKPLIGFREAKPMVFAGLYPIDSSQYEDLKESLEKLKLNDDAISYELESSQALGFGFRCGFLGLLHMDIIKERLEREFGMELITTAPMVIYNVHKVEGDIVAIESPAQLPPALEIDHIEEPIIDVTLHLPEFCLGNIITLCEKRRGRQKNLTYHGSSRVMLEYEIPMAEVLFDFYDKLKSLSKGYASMDYTFKEYQSSNLVKLDILLNGDSVDALSVIVHRDNSYYRGRELCKKMRELIPRQMYDVAIQAAIGSKIISRETVKAYRKNVTAKCYGGDISRKKKLLQKQKEGKKRMKQVGNVEVPQEAFWAVLKIEE